MLSEMMPFLILWVVFAIAALLLRPPESRDVRVIDHETAEFRVLLNEASVTDKCIELRFLRKKILALQWEKVMARAVLAANTLQEKLVVYSELNELQAEHAKGTLEKIQTHLRWKTSIYVRKVHAYFCCS